MGQEMRGSLTVKKDIATSLLSRHGVADQGRRGQVLFKQPACWASQGMILPPLPLS